MNSRIVAGVLGAITLLMGIGGLVTPDRVMAFVGFAPRTEANRVLALGEVRAILEDSSSVLGVSRCGARTRLIDEMLASGTPRQPGAGALVAR